MRTRHVLFLIAGLAAAPLAGCSTAHAVPSAAVGKSEVPDCVKRYTGEDCGCAQTGLGAGTLVAGANKTVAGMTKGAATGMGQGVSSFCNPVANVLYAPFGLVTGAFTGVTDGVGHVPAVQDCHVNFGQSLGYAWWRDYRVGTQNAQVPEHRFRAANGSDGQWNGGSYWPGGPK